MAESILDVMASLTGWFSGTSWSVWRALLTALFALPMAEEQLATYRKHTGREQPPTRQAREGWLIIGRRGGKSLIAALVALWAAVFRRYEDILVPGERGLVMVVAQDMKQARVVFRYLIGFFDRIPGLSQLIERRTQEALHLSNGISIEIHAASFRSLRGYTIVAFIADEIAFWSDESSANPDVEILNAVRPAQATVPGAVFLCISSPYARRGALWQAFSAHYGRDGDPIFVWAADTASMNPRVPLDVIEQAYEADEAVAAAEYGRDGIIMFRRDIEGFVSREVIEACVVPGRIWLPPIRTERYEAFGDPAGGSGADAFTWGIAHSEERDERTIVVLDALQERRPPFSPEAVTRECAMHLAAYGITRIVGDRYAGEWPTEQFAKHGIIYEPAERPKSDLYRDCLPLFTSGAIELLDLPRLHTQLLGLERRTARGGRDSIDHAPHGHDDLANAAAGSLLLAARPRPLIQLW